MKAIKKKLKVTFPDGTVFCFKDAVFTVIETLKKIGSERFDEINLFVKEQRLVSFGRQNGYSSSYIKEICDGWFYLNQSDAYTKFLQLDNIRRQLNLDIKIELNEAFKAQCNPKTTRKSSKRQTIKVTMADGGVIDYEGHGDVFMTCIDKLSPRNVSAKANIDFHGSSLFTTSNISGNRLKVAEFLYVAIPQTAKETFKILKLISARLGLSRQMQIELVDCA